MVSVMYTVVGDTALATEVVLQDLHAKSRLSQALTKVTHTHTPLKGHEGHRAVVVVVVPSDWQRYIWLCTPMQVDAMMQAFVNVN